jgi:hypothetical protein
VVDTSQILLTSLQSIESKIKDSLRANGKVATGKTINSLLSEVKDNTDYLRGTLSGRAFFSLLETGRPPASKKGDNTFKDRLKEWAEAKSIPLGNFKDYEAFGKFLAWYINKNGTKLYRSGQTLDLFGTIVKDEGDKLVKKLSENYLTYVLQAYDNINK